MIIDRSSLRWLAGWLSTRFLVGGFGGSLIFSKYHLENQGEGEGAGCMRYKMSQDFGGYNKL